MEPLLNKLVVQPRPGATFPPSPAPNPFGLPGVVARKHGRFGINRSSAVHGGGNPESKELRVDGVRAMQGGRAPSARAARSPSPAGRPKLRSIAAVLLDD